VRARSRSDLELLVDAAGLHGDTIIHTPHADYAWRIAISQQKLGKVFAALQRSVNYPNFKAEIACRPSQTAKLSAYHSLWSAMYRLQADS